MISIEMLMVKYISNESRETGEMRNLMDYVTNAIVFYLEGKSIPVKYRSNPPLPPGLLDENMRNLFVKSV